MTESALFARADELVRRAELRSLDRKIAAHAPLTLLDRLKVERIMLSNPREFRGLSVESWQRHPDGGYTVRGGAGVARSIQYR